MSITVTVEGGSHRRSWASFASLIFSLLINKRCSGGAFCAFRNIPTCNFCCPTDIFVIYDADFNNIHEGSTVAAPKMRKRERNRLRK